MYYQLRKKDGRASATSAGVLVGAGGDVVRLDSQSVSVDVLQYWRSAKGRRAEYPAAWRLTLAQPALSLTVEPLLAGQEHKGTFPYWEGAVQVKDATGARVGFGYVELTGY